jgi:hypothetical protein
LIYDRVPRYNLPAQPVTNVVGPNDPSKPGVEASLDIECIPIRSFLFPLLFLYILYTLILLVFRFLLFVVLQFV